MTDSRTTLFPFLNSAGRTSAYLTAAIDVAKSDRYRAACARMRADYPTSGHLFVHWVTGIDAETWQSRFRRLLPALGAIGFLTRDDDTIGVGVLSEIAAAYLEGIPVLVFDGERFRDDFFVDIRDGRTATNVRSATVRIGTGVLA